MAVPSLDMGPRPTFCFTLIKKIISHLTVAGLVIVRFLPDFGQFEISAKLTIAAGLKLPSSVPVSNLFIY